jgi:hypothetical protein
MMHQFFSVRSLLCRLTVYGISQNIKAITNLEAAGSSETLVHIYETTRPCIPEINTLHRHINISARLLTEHCIYLQFFLYVKRSIECITFSFIVPYIVVNTKLNSGERLTHPGENHFIEICSAVSETCTT